MKRILFFLILIMVANAVFSQTDSVCVTFIIEAERLTAKDSIFITGNNKKLGRWKPSLIHLNKAENRSWTKQIIFAKGTELEYKFTRGSWLTEAVDSNGVIPQNHLLKVMNDTTVTHYIPGWSDQFEYKVRGQITGEVEYLENLKTGLLLPRDVIVWLPPNYRRDTELNYPVLYMHDGQNIIDPETSTFGIDWQIDETADSLIKNNLIEPVIIVGIYNTDNRYSEYSENDTGYAYMEFIVKDLKPIIDSIYRTKPGREYTAVAGSSMGGLISFMIAWEYPEVFSKAASLSPAFKIKKYNFVDNVENYSGNKKDLLLYIDNGGIALEDSLQPGIDEMLKQLNRIGFKEGKDLYWYKDETAEHNEAAWAERTRLFLTYFFQKNN